jgi:lipoyl(octanoyl) transferase
MSPSVVRVGFGPPLGDGYVDYHPAWKLQQDVHAAVVAGTEPDTVLLLEHSPVYTAGKRTNSWERPTDGTPVVDVDRGGRITWHGPGQIVGYPITRLPDPIDVVAYVRRVEQLLIDVIAEFGVETIRIDGRSGVWVPADRHGPDRKVAAIGVRVSRGVTMHGFALNISNSLDAYRVIVPCGITDAGVTTLAVERERHGLPPVTVADALPALERHLPSLTSAAVVVS